MNDGERARPADTVAVVLADHLSLTLGGVLWCCCGAGSFEGSDGHRRHVAQVLVNDGEEGRTDG